MPCPELNPVGVFVFMNERDAPSLSEQPSVHVLSWRALRTSSGHLHLLMLREPGVVRNTSAVRSVDPARRVLTTSSGREYLLHCQPEEEPMAKAQLLAGAARMGLAASGDVSDELWAQFSAGHRTISAPYASID